MTRDGGKTWTKTDKFPNVPETTFVSRVVWSKANEGTLYATLDGHRSNDFKPYVVKSTDYGKTWTSITGDLPDGGSVQVIREHPRQPNLLFVGTEFGVYLHDRRRRALDAAQERHPGRSGARHADSGARQRSRRRHARPRHLHPRRPHATRASRARRRRRRSRTSSRFKTRCSSSRTRAASSGMGTRGFAGQNPEPGPAHHVLCSMKFRPSAKVSLSIVDASGTTVRELPVNQAARPVSHRRGTCASARRSPVRSTRSRCKVDADAAVAGRGGRGGGGAAARHGRSRWIPGRVAAVRLAGAGAAVAAVAAALRRQHVPAMPGHYIARLTVTPAKGAPTILEQSFALTKDPMVTLTRRRAEAALRVPSRRREAAARASRAASAARHGAAHVRRGETRGRFGGHEGDAGAQDADRGGRKGARRHHA